MSSPSVAVGSAVPVVARTPEPVDLFMFSAAAWLLHRIHYDLPFTTDHEGHPNLLIHGPLQGNYMIQSIQWWLGRGARLRRISYRHTAPAYLGDTLECGGTITEVTTDGITADLWVRKLDGTLTTSGVATFDWNSTREAEGS